MTDSVDEILDSLRRATPPIPEEKLAPLRAKVVEAKERGVDLSFSDDIIHDLHVFHDVDVVEELCKVIDNQIAVQDAIKGGASVEEAVQSVLDD